MTGRSFLLVYGAVLAATIGYAATSCTSETQPIVATSPIGYGTKVTITSPAIPPDPCQRSPDGGVANDVPPLACAVAFPGHNENTDKGPFFSVTVRVDDFLIRPPGACPPIGNCGHVKLTLEGGKTTTWGMTSTIDAPLRDFADRYGEKTLTVQLVDDYGFPWVHAPILGWDGGEPETGPGDTTKIPIFKDTLKVLVVHSLDECPQWTCELGDGGSGGSTSSTSSSTGGSGGTGGTTSTGGSGGTGGTTGSGGTGGASDGG